MIVFFEPLWMRGLLELIGVALLVWSAALVIRYNRGGDE